MPGEKCDNLGDLEKSIITWKLLAAPRELTGLNNPGLQYPRCEWTEKLSFKLSGYASNAAHTHLCLKLITISILEGSR